MSLCHIGLCNNQPRKSSVGKVARRADGWRVEVSASERRIVWGVAASVVRFLFAHFIAVVADRLSPGAPGVASFVGRRFGFRSRQLDTLPPNKSFKPTALHAAA